jgi:hypothetical protein
MECVKKLTSRAYSKESFVAPSSTPSCLAGEYELELSASDLGIQQIYTGRLDLDQDLVLTQLRPRHHCGTNREFFPYRSRINAFMVVLIPGAPRFASGDLAMCVFIS